MAWTIWDKTSPVTLADNTIVTPDELFKRFPVSRKSDILLNLIGDRAVAIEDYEVLKEIYDVSNPDPIAGMAEIKNKQKQGV